MKARRLVVDLDEMQASIDRLAEAWEHEKTVKSLLVAECAAKKITPANDHWHAEHHARKRLESARRVYDAVLKLYEETHASVGRRA